MRRFLRMTRLLSALLAVALALPVTETVAVPASKGDGHELSPLPLSRSARHTTGPATSALCSMRYSGRTRPKAEDWRGMSTSESVKTSKATGGTSTIASEGSGADLTSMMNQPGPAIKTTRTIANRANFRTNGTCGGESCMVKCNIIDLIQTPHSR